MSDPQAASTKAADPLEQWRELRDAYMDIWAKASGEAVNSEAYAQATGTMLEAFLSTSSPYREAQKKAMISALEQLNMPSRDDYVRMAERLANLELLLDDMDARLREMYRQLSRAAQSTSAAPRPSPAAQPVAAAPQPAPAAAQPAAVAEPRPKAEKRPPAEPELFAGLSAAPVPATKAAKKAAARKAPAKSSKKGSK